MKVSFPQLGPLHIPLRTLLTELDLDVVVPPPTTKRTLDIGVRHSPEFVCLPYKLMLGNFVEAAAQGADTFLMVEGPGLCRLGFYAETQQAALAELGVAGSILPVDVSENALLQFLRTLQKLSGKPWHKIVGALGLGLAKLRAIERLDRLALQLRPREIQPGTMDTILPRALKEIDEVGGGANLRRTSERWVAELRAVPRDEDRRVVKVGLIGEFFVVLDPFSNRNVEQLLGKNGVQAVKFLYASDWLDFHFFLKLLHVVPEQHSVAQAAKPYIGYDLSGDGQKSLGQTVICAERHYDGVVHLMPFSCMPEIVALYQLPRASADHDIPVLSVTVDEKLADAGLETRIEAFVDLLRLRAKDTPTRSERSCLAAPPSSAVKDKSLQ